MDNIWNVFKQRTLEIQHIFNNMLVQSYNQSTQPRENMVFNDLEDQQIQQAMALSIGQNVQNIQNYRNDIFPPPLPPTPNEYLREQNDMMQEDDTPYEDDEDLLNLALRESMKEAKERGDMKDDEREPNNTNNNLNQNNNNNNNNFIFENFGNINNEKDNVDEIIKQIRRERNEKKIREQRNQLLIEQEEAYQESLQQDNLKKLEEEKKIQQEMEHQKELEQKKEIEQALLLSKELFKKNKIEKVLNNIPLEPPKNEKDSVEILVRLTDGTKVSRRFKHDDTLQHLHNWIVSLSEERSIPEIFSISQSFPRKKFTDLNLSFKESNLVGSVVLLIENEEEEDLY
eukprot:TRINITY_DN754_c5_g1_i1.p1 TRINITY_DN754_c5_g1~~TRINITY_DN754_c5_g1_i1.p1  ORF type:complete len:343 (-),score=146.84 TRINITY_DN754_c5_g1_i1:64-1092(-)